MSPTASRIATIALSTAAIAVLAATFGTKGCAEDGPAPSYRTEGAPFASGTVEGVLVLSSSARERIASAVSPEPDGCDEPAREQAAVVWIDGPSSGTAPPSGSAKVRLGGCGFEPVVATAMADSKLTVYSSSREHRIQAWLDGVRVYDASEGGTAEIRLVSPGVWRIRCAAGHAGEEAWVVATKTPYARVVEPSRGFEIAAVPAGRWTLVAWHPALGARHVDVEVSTKETTRAEIDF